jgi:CheY-like chemotaxis protein
MPGTVLLVEGGAATASILRNAGYDVAEVSTSERAVERMRADPPDLVMIEALPSSFNGLPLLRRPEELPRIATIVLTPISDPLIEAESKRHQVKCVVKTTDPRDLLAAVSIELATSHRLRRWPRWQTIDPIGARIAGRPAVVLDVSYEGLRFEIPPPVAESLSTPVQVRLVENRLVVSALPVWTHRMASGVVLCGAKLLDADPAHVHLWRTTVNAVAHPA